VVCASGMAGKAVRMLSAWFGIGGEEEVSPGRILMERDGVPTSRQTTILMWEGGGPSFGQVLDVGDSTARTIVFVLHEETVNQYPGMAFYGGIFYEGGMSMRAIEHGVVAPFHVRATIDLAGQWRIMGFSGYSIS
jgi:hypothetical protein